MLRMLRVALGICVLAVAGTVVAEDAFFRVSIRDLELTKGKLPDRDGEADAEAFVSAPAPVHNCAAAM